MPRYAYLTCELKSRDLDSRLLIARHLLQKGISVVVGQQWSMVENIETSPSGVFLFKTANKIQTVNIERAKRRHRVVAMDEEALAICDPMHLRMIVDPNAISLADLFLYHSAEHRSALAGDGPIVGSPRLDLLQSERALFDAETAKCKSAGPYSLLNTNFALVNSVWGAPQNVVKIATQAWHLGHISESEAREFFQSWIDTESANMKLLVEVLQWLSSHRQGRRIVVRPHPAENAAAWSNVPGVEVVAGTNPIPWILGADLTLHCNSTTGLEASYLGCHALNVNPLPTSVFSNVYVTNASPFQAHTLEEAQAAITAFLAGEKQSPPVPAQVPRAADLIATHIASLAREESELRHWKKHPLGAAAAAKFTLFPDEFKARLSALGITVKPRLLDASLFLLSPA